MFIKIYIVGQVWFVIVSNLIFNIFTNCKSDLFNFFETQSLAKFFVNITNIHELVYFHGLIFEDGFTAWTVATMIFLKLGLIFLSWIIIKF